MLLYLFCNKSHYENVPFEIPGSWCWCKLSDVCNFESGYAFSSDDYKDKGIPLVRISNIQDGLVSLDNCVYIEGDIDKRFIINNGDLLIAMSGATTGKMGVYQYDCPALLNQRVGNIKVNTSLLLQKYRDYFMQSQGDLILKLSYGGAQPNVSAKIISDLFIPIPSLNEQEKIVAEIEKWFGFIDEIEAGKIELESYIKQTKSKILDLAISGKLVPQDPNDEPAIELLKRINPDFEPCDNSHYENLPFEVPDGWCWAKINDVTEFIKNGAQIKQFKGASGIPITRIETISNSELDMARMGYANITNGAEYKDYYIKDGDILMSHINSRAHIGKCALCNVGENQIIHGMNLLRIRCSKQILPEYMVYYFRSTTFYNLIEPHIKNAVNQASINITNLQKILIRIPPYSEQRRVAFIVDKLFSTIDTITAEL